MTKQLPENVSAVIEAFNHVFSTTGRRWGARTRGVSDDAKGVQWNCGITQDGDEAFLGVNLEGMQYRGWPVSTLIQNELQRPTLLDEVKTHAELQRVELSWRRDAWQRSSRPPIDERYIAPTPINLSSLTPNDWKDALTQALNCLDEERDHRGRAKQVVTLLPSRVRKPYDVSPHLHFKWSLWHGSPPSPRDAILRMREARNVLTPLYDWTKKHCE